MYAELTILGSNSASPTKYRNPSGQHFKLGSDQILIDCGEGTQKRLITNRINYQKINIILISHLHGDHFLGLMGLLNTMSLNGRKSGLEIICPVGLQDLVHRFMTTTKAHDTFPISFTELEEEQSYRIERENVFIEAIPVSHRISCFAYIIEQKVDKRKINQEECEAHNIPFEAYNSLKEGKDFTTSTGEVIANEILTEDPHSPITYGYVTDTLYRPDLTERFSKCHTLYHEATYLHNLIDRATKTSHSTALQAAQFAAKASVNQLLIGHFSSRYLELEEHLKEASSVFPETFIAEEGKTFLIY